MKAKFQKFSRVSILLPGLLLVLAGCETTQSPPPQSAVRAPELPATPAPASDKPSALSYGMVTGRVKKDVTSQQEVLELFGGPNTMTTDKDGTEIWMYDKTASTVSGTYAQSSAQAEKSDASVMAAFLGLPLLGGVGAVKSTGQSQSATVGQGANSVTRSVKNITFILKFNSDKTVKDYAVRQSSY